MGDGVICVGKSNFNLMLCRLLVAPSATVPPGVSPGQMIQVAAPDGRIVQAAVPPGMSTGSTFMVRFPRAPPVVPISLPQAVAVEEPTLAVAVAEPVPSAPATPVDTINPYSNVTPVTAPPSTASAPGAPDVVPFSQALDHQLGPPPAASHRQQHRPVAPPQSLPTPPPGQELLLVKVPPGTAPGTTLHVTIPNDGRTLAAQVPPGNVKEFHVAYQPLQRQQPSRSNLQQSRFGGNNQQQSRFGINQQQSRFSNTRNSQSGNSMWLPLLGGAALGAAGMATYDQFAHHRHDNGGGDYTGGGDDFGGDFDY